MLLPVTSNLVWWARRPETAENMERSMGRSSSGVGSPVGGGSRGGQDRDQDAAEVLATSVMRPIETETPPTIAVASVVSLPSRTDVTSPVCLAPVSSV